MTHILPLHSLPSIHTLLTHTLHTHTHTHTLPPTPLFSHITPSNILSTDSFVRNPYLGILTAPVPQICHFASFWPPLPRLPAPGYGLPPNLPTQTLEVCENLIFLNILANILWFAGRTTNPESGPRHLNCARI